MIEKISENISFGKYIGEYRPKIEASLHHYLPLVPAQIKTDFNEAVEYSIFPGGKRLRPILTLLGAKLVGGKEENVLPAAIAVEYVHTSSLIFDDLPCMDNAGERRGKTSVHEKFGEGLAILVGLAFLNASYGLVFVNHSNLPERAIKAHAELSECVGAAGMLGGQSVDLALAQGATSLGNSSRNYESESIRNLKTSSLLRLALRIGAILVSAKSHQLNALSRFADLLGDAYQLSDDLLDLEEDGKIFSTNQTTFAINQGRETANLKLKTIVEEAKETLFDNFAPSEARDNLEYFTDYLTVRKN